ncbi:MULTISPECIES: fatty acid metabolism transcriptional regulator FadR [Pseudoalteromonas]|jgi:GntR family negative regulator for fad regulon and positive regulator of fabA|uniref:fatty acid metabolism transcriptional regulator FadR n=1 Tax=Pseudoalteromonas TaxID=53246 RepID=UPI0003FFF512|nr:MULTISPECIES: fatty acid metabolism transcriptional regulator FadR [unclassified Pseudoalteromonas]MBB1276665.1 fatty acid metabolism transcriptional regulator FadR [Pseudoalteromonas sp. SR43-3]MBB1327081.1 fatty acid metabolism transcriptional regulator FadR [Pseudoalteromonas sp. SR45-1]MBB1356299.1 fatty acid metabolism transcriptional regulator FadR [Pseudoalteromonas sp. SR45-5]MBB1430103.1 fatty acid metabolism transcriptional regulator FadR [Pseudoalteromonas sp. SG43-4]MBH0030386.1|tara:strand:- start:237 stop:950 length:714 start_codon:yes stop_codon:yes gene_type:complete
MRIFKAKSPAGFAEEYIVESIWNGDFPPGSILPAERELSELIGVTRTTLREVLQRLARDGWLTIQHGKPTKVNNFWETSGLNILETLARLDEDKMPELTDQLLSARTNISAIYTRAAIKLNPERVIEILSQSHELEDTAQAFADYDYKVHHELAVAGNNRIYVLILNGFRGFYSKIGCHYFSDAGTRELARQFYKDLTILAEKKEHDGAISMMRKYGHQTGEIWQKIRGDMPSDIMD